MTVRTGGGNKGSEGGRRKNIKYKTERGYWGAYSSRTERCEVFSTNRHRRLSKLHELRTV